MKALFNFLAIIFGILFIVSAALQYNDPDALIWMIIWGIAGVISLTFGLKGISFSIPLIAGVAALIGFFYTYPEEFEGFTIGVGEIKNVEEGREAFGLLIIAIVLLILGIRGWWVARQSKV